MNIHLHIKYAYIVLHVPWGTRGQSMSWDKTFSLIMKSAEVTYKTAFGRLQTDLSTRQHLYTEVSSEQSGHHPDGLSHTGLSPGCVLENGSHCGNNGQNVHPKDRGQVRSLQLFVQLGVTQQSHLLDDLLPTITDFCIYSLREFALYHVAFPLL